MNLLSKTALDDLFAEAQKRMLADRELLNLLQEFSAVALKVRKVTEESSQDDYVNAYVALAARAMVYGTERAIQRDDIIEVLSDKEAINFSHYRHFLDVAFRMEPCSRHNFLWSNRPQGLHSYRYYPDLQSAYLERTA